MTVFPSLTRKDIVYKIAYDSSFSYTKTYRLALAHSCYEYLTYGDGLNQHSPTNQVDTEQILDFLVSLGKCMIENPDTISDVASTTYWPHEMHYKEIDFFLSLEHNPEKILYYNASERKVSSSDKKRFDKRWEEVPSWAKKDNLDSCFRLFINQRYMPGIEKLSLYYDIQDRISDRFNWCSDLDGFGIDYTGEKYPLKSAFFIVNNLIKACRLQESAKRSFDSLLYNLKLKEN